MPPVLPAPALPPGKPPAPLEPPALLLPPGNPLVLTDPPADEEPPEDDELRPPEKSGRPDEPPGAPEGMPLEPEGIPLEPDGIPLEPEGIPLEPEGIPLEPDGIPLDPDGIPLGPEGMEDPEDGEDGPDGILEPEEEGIGGGVLLWLCCELSQPPRIRAEMPTASANLSGNGVVATLLNNAMVLAPLAAITRGDEILYQLMSRPGRDPIIALAAGGIQSCRQSDIPSLRRG